MSSTAPGHHAVSPDDHGAWITVISFLLLAWMLCVYLTRVYIRVRFTPWGWDDNIITVGTVLAIAQVIITDVAVHHGLGKRGSLLSSAQLYAAEEYLYIAQVLYIMVLGLSKCATSVLILRLTRTRPHQLATYVIIGLTALWSVASVFVIAFRGDVHHPWTEWDQPNSGLYPRWIAIEVVGMVIELAIVVLSVILLSILQMKSIIKIMVIAAFFSRVLVIIPAIIRLYYLRPSYNAPDPTFNNVYAIILTQVAMHYGLIAASIPCLKPFIRPFDKGYVGDTGYGPNSSNTGAMFPAKSRASSHESHVMLTSRDSAAVDRVIPPANYETGEERTRRDKGKTLDIDNSGLRSRSTSQNRTVSRSASRSATRNGETWTSRGVRVHQPGNPSLRPDVGEMITVVEHSPHQEVGRRSSFRRDKDARWKGEHMVINQTKEYEVRFDKAAEAGDPV